MSSFSDDDKIIIKLINNFFLKACLLIYNSDLCLSSGTVGLRDSLKFDDEWFETLETETEDFPDNIALWTHFDGTCSLPPMVIETFLDIRQLPSTCTLRLMDTDGNLWNVCKGGKKTEVLIERWLIELDSESATFKTTSPPQDGDDDGDNAVSLNKQIALLLRYLHTLSQLLPAYTLSRSLVKNIESQSANASIGGENRAPLLSIGSRILDGSKPILSRGRIGLSKPIINTYSNVINESNIPAHLEQKKITAVWTKYGLLRVSVSYRRECKFEIHDSEELVGNNVYSSHTAGSLALFGKRSVSISPSIRGSGGPSSFENQQQSSLPRKSVGITRQVQPFKVGSVSSAANERGNSQASTRNPSFSNVSTQNLTSIARRSSIGSNPGAIINLQANVSNPSLFSNSNASNINNLHGESGSVESGSKYISSFGNIRRHSSIYRNTEHLNSIDRALRSNSDANSTSKNRSNSNSYDKRQTSLRNSTNDEDLLDFVKMIDLKPEIKFQRKLSGGSSTNVNISNSLLKYQNLRPNNDMLSEDLSMSYSLDPLTKRNSNSGGNLNTPTTRTRGHSQTSSSPHSHSPFLSSSPPLQYQSIAYKTVDSSSNSRRSSLERNLTPHNTRIAFMPPIFGGESQSYHDTGASHRTSSGGANSDNGPSAKDRKSGHISEAADIDEEDALMLDRQQKPVSTSPRSTDSMTGSIRNAELPYRQSSVPLSQPALVPVSAHAKLHRPQNIHSRDILTTGRHINHGTVNRSSTDDGDEDDDLMFFMSDMNLSSK
ncbi:serine/threonine protein kinase regulatory subunit ATG13 KNAG_0F03970 [Huiozyma naganishii CBS 8797]|uniref:Autophagy-related protein 13 n=1 Tax=Huiozyma naganishii (strain ATCC MYA-139 / BCRC 22969 / CBS 8797 / KCTC 17520 / NBRC 10181 / NCYC 3082 / Yp74L-3) TaxID=1071383 RepID=J7S8S0_HUIN7|nr:hypothetical protein KNAG_0F03970 [Kazachstania naganishii CBS 8797]CCK71061.1 hypothetical protein KNAG_0F03970 [Kazachstania naganishii CBS 8797]